MTPTAHRVEDHLVSRNSAIVRIRFFFNFFLFSFVIDPRVTRMGSDQGDVIAADAKSKVDSAMMSAKKKIERGHGNETGTSSLLTGTEGRQSEAGVRHQFGRVQRLGSDFVGFRIPQENAALTSP